MRDEHCTVTVITTDGEILSKTVHRNLAGHVVQRLLIGSLHDFDPKRWGHRVTVEEIEVRPAGGTAGTPVRRGA